LRGVRAPRDGHEAHRDVAVGYVDVLNDTIARNAVAKPGE
jgi:hypothetical protein